ncbi:hypothetical protein SAMN04487895_101743 [Paenibacillus sophorae]|uniref:Phage major capsid protein, HK97 family n=1 Tax=Paenibacillus sophorae TaxID=1333845 RepID=A0A1H8H3Y6_9BACL|nr:hypothetical protein [Paenibacillus sophorae]QWU14431.1 hypothetical protein KP014_21220 [Paenibacillus sophorae]SEN50710.1 hypothetical protein SAMN04487895_101743 [Paenibacillus sophorae]
MLYDDQKIKGLFSRVLDTKNTSNDDAEDIKAYCSKVFGDGSKTPDPSMLHQFNNLIVEEADKIVKPKATKVLDLLAAFVPRNRGDIYQYNISKEHKAKVVWAALGTGVDLIRVDGKKSKVATPASFQTGFSYEPLDLVNDSIENFRKLVDDVGEAKIRLYMQQVSKLMQAAISAGDIPAANVKTGSNLGLADYNKVASTLQRYGGRPVFVADTLLIDYFAQQATGAGYKDLLTDDLRTELRTALNPTSIGRTTAVNLVNPFTDETNSKVEIPVNEGYMMAGAVNQKPFIIVEYGGMRQYTEQDPSDERIKLKITQEAAIELLYGEAIGYIKEDAAVNL